MIFSNFVGMKLSIIIPVYHTQDTLPRCLDSILRQSFTDYEVILVDDGSTDDSPKICDAYSRQDGRVKVIHKENGGLSDARNAGIHEAKGEYITFIDSDDTIAEDTLSLVIEKIITYPKTDILEYPVMERLGNGSKEHLLSFKEKEYQDAIDYWLEEKAYNHTYAWNKIYKRTLFKHICFPKGKNFEDVLTVPYLIGLLPYHGSFVTPNIRTTNVGCYEYRWNAKGITANATYKDLYNLYDGHTQSLQAIMNKIGSQEKLIQKYSLSLQIFMTQILNVLLDLYELSGQYENNPPVIHHVEKLGKSVKIKVFKLRLLNIIGYHNLCRLNKFVHRLYRRK